MKRLALSSSALALVAMAASSGSLAPATAAPLVAHPFNPRGNTAAVREAIAERFPGATFPPAEQVFCSPGEHSMKGPASYCFAEFTTGPGAPPTGTGPGQPLTVNLVEAEVDFNGGSAAGFPVTIYRHSRWVRRWTRCRLRRGVPGTLFSNESAAGVNPNAPWSRRTPSCSN